MELEFEVESWRECDFSRVKSFASGFHLEKFFPFGLDGLESELLRWRIYWLRQTVANRPKRVMNALNRALQIGTYPIISKLLHIFATIPVTTATNERSLSSLKLIKTFLRTTTEEDRLNGLAHLFINKDIHLDYDKVINEFERKNRRLKFV